MSAITDLSVLTTIPEKSLSHLLEKLEWIICNAVDDARLEGKDTAEIDLEMGTLFIRFDSESVAYKFIPSTTFDNKVKNTIIKKSNPLTCEVEKRLVKKITSTYKDLF